MMNDPTIASLLTAAAQYLRAEFELARTNPHAGDRGHEVEAIVRRFLNGHLPQRFRAGSGIIIDFDNRLSRQTDVIVYDAQSSPVYRAAEETLILPNDTVAAVVEVKSRLNRTQLSDAFEKIASCKALRKSVLTKVDQEATRTGTNTTSTLGIVFAFDADVSLEALADGMVELNRRYASSVWPDFVVVLDKGILEYQVQWPGSSGLAGSFATQPPPDVKCPVPPWYIHLGITKDELSLNRFFLRLISHLKFYPFRSGIPPFDVLLGSARSEAMTCAAYMFNTKRELVPVPDTLRSESQPRPELSMNVFGPDGRQIGVVQFMSWQDGGVVRSVGVPLEALLLLLLPNTDAMVMNVPAQPSLQYSEVMPLNQELFRRWPEAIAAKSNMRAEIMAP